MPFGRQLAKCRKPLVLGRLAYAATGTVFADRDS